MSLNECQYKKQQLEQLLRALLGGNCPLRSLDLTGTSLCMASPTRYVTDVLAVVCSLITAPGSAHHPEH